MDHSRDNNSQSQLSVSFPKMAWDVLKESDIFLGLNPAEAITSALLASYSGGGQALP